MFEQRASTKISWDIVAEKVQEETSNILGKHYKCKATKDDYEYWTVVFDEKLSIRDLIVLLSFVNASDAVREDTMPIPEDPIEDYGCIGMLLAEQLLKKSLGYDWEERLITDDALWLVGIKNCNKAASVLDNKVMLVERDYKGIYERYALTFDEFAMEYPVLWSDIKQKKSILQDSYTEQPLVHIWYCPTSVGSTEWIRFFTDMSWGMSESDIEQKNFASIRLDLAQSLRNDIANMIKEEN